MQIRVNVRDRGSETAKKFEQGTSSNLDGSYEFNYVVDELITLF